MARWPNALTVVLAGALVLPSVARADRLPKEACDALRQEETGLVTAGVKSDMEKGPEWAKANLPAERLQQIARLIEVGEQISFRCRVIVVPVKKKGPPVAKPGVKPGTKPDKSAAAPAADGATEAKPTTKPKVIRLKPVQKPAQKPIQADSQQKKPTGTPKPATVKKSKPPPQQTGLFGSE